MAERVAEWDSGNLEDRQIDSTTVEMSTVHFDEGVEAGNTSRGNADRDIQAALPVLEIHRCVLLGVWRYKWYADIQAQGCAGMLTQITLHPF